jgi:uncharacterized protein (TIGR02145 family)
MKKLSLIVIALLSLFVISCDKEEEKIVVTGVTVTPPEIVLEVGDQQKLTANVQPENASDKTVVWWSSRTDFVTVDATGNLTAEAIGVATITATSKDGGKVGSAKVTVQEKVYHVTGITVAPSTVTLQVTETADIVATIAPDNASNRAVTWSSNDETVATVDVATGEITAVSVGSATITVTTADGNRTATVAVTVESTPLTGLVVKNSVFLAKGASETITVTFEPPTATNKNLSWSSSDTDIATVDNGTITAVELGSAVITVTSVENPAISREIQITVPSMGGPEPGSLVVLNANAPSEAALNFSWEMPSGSPNCELVVSLNADMTSPITALSASGSFNSKSFTNGEVQALITNGTLPKRYKNNTLYWMVKIDGQAIGEIESFNLGGYRTFTDMRGSESITYMVSVIDLVGDKEGKQAVWMAENLRATKDINGNPLEGSAELGDDDIYADDYCTADMWEIVKNEPIPAHIRPWFGAVYSGWRLYAMNIIPADWKLPKWDDVEDLFGAAKAHEGKFKVLVRSDIWANGDEDPNYNAFNMNFIPIAQAFDRLVHGLNSVGLSTFAWDSREDFPDDQWADGVRTLVFYPTYRAASNGGIIGQPIDGKWPGEDIYHCSSSMAGGTPVRFVYTGDDN